MAVRQGICRGGPKDGKVQTKDARTWAEEGGIYVYQPPAGPKPGEWLWIEDKKK